MALTELDRLGLGRNRGWQPACWPPKRERVLRSPGHPPTATLLGL